MRLVRVALVLAALAACSPDVCVTGDTPKPSAANNQPATPAPIATVRPAGQTPAPSAAGAGAGAANAATPPPGQTTPTPGAPPAATPAPTPSSPTPTTAAPSTTPAVASTPAPVTKSADSSSSASSTPAPSAALPVTTSSDSDSSGMSAGSVIGIILAVLAVVGIAGFFGYRHVQSRRDHDHDNDGHHGNKHFDYPVNSSPQEVTIMGSQQSDYTLSKMERASSQDMPIMAAGAGSVLSSLNNSSYASGTTLQNTYNSNNNSAASNTYGQYNGGYGNNNSSNTATNTSNNNNSNNNYNGTQYSESSSVSSPSFAKSTSQYLNGPDQESPPFKKTEVQLSRPSSVLLDEPMEFNHSFAESYAESYSESYSDRGYMSSFVQGMPGSDGLSVGATSAMGDALDRDTATHNDNAHWLDAMRDTGDSYAMLEADAYGSERGSAISRFSTDSEYNRESQL